MPTPQFKITAMTFVTGRDRTGVMAVRDMRGRQISELAQLDARKPGLRSRASTPKLWYKLPPILGPLRVP